MKISELLHRDANNLDIFRVLAACMVIYGHAYPLSPEAGHEDFLREWVGFDYSASLAVKLFFFLSGLVVTNSLMEKRNPVQFVVARVFRIWPALLVTLVLTALVIGPLVTSLPPQEYLTNRSTYHYIYYNLILRSYYLLPGVFNDNVYKDAVNGSLWTIPYEVTAYVALLALFLLRILDRKLLVLLVFAGLSLNGVLKIDLLPGWTGQASLLAPCFAFGALCAIFKRQLSINLYVVVLAWLPFFVTNNAALKQCFFLIAFFILVLHLSSTQMLLKLKPKADLSYGTYLWGFPVQQVVSERFLDWGIVFNQALSLVVALGLAMLSWHFIEKQSIAIGASLGRRLAPGGRQALLK